MNDVSVAVDKLISYARKNLGLAKENEICARNAVLDVLGSPEYAYTGKKSGATSPDEVLCELFSACGSAGIFSDDERQEYADKIMGALTLSPKEIRRRFSAEAKRAGSRAATD